MNVDTTISYRVRAVLILLCVALLAYVGRLYHLDDALIYARYIRNALHGHGLVFNPGEPVNALTSILYAWMLLALSWLLHGRILLAEVLISGTFLATAALLAEAMVPLAGLIIATSSYFYLCSGMETSPFLTLILLCVRAYLDRKLNWLPLLCMLAALTRFEGGALALVIAWRLWQDRRFPKLAAYVPVVMLAALYFASNWKNYGVLLPQSAAAKFGQGMAGFWGRWPTAFIRLPPEMYYPLFGSQIIAPILLLLVALAARRAGMRPLNRVVLPFLIGFGAFCVLLNIPNYFWYYAPFLYFAYIYAASLIPQAGRPQWIAVGLAVCLAVVSGMKLRESTRNWRDYIAAATWMSTHLPSDAVVATTETGNIGWYCDRRIIDLVGLTTPQNATYTRHRDFTSWIKEKPEYVIVHPDRRFPWERVALDSPDYEPVQPSFQSVWLLHRKN